MELPLLTPGRLTRGSSSRTGSAERGQDEPVSSGSTAAASHVRRRVRCQDMFNPRRRASTSGLSTGLTGAMTAPRDGSSGRIRTGEDPPTPDDSDTQDPGFNASQGFLASDRLSRFRIEKGTFRGQSQRPSKSRTAAAKPTASSDTRVEFGTEAAPRSLPRDELRAPGIDVRDSTGDLRCPRTAEARLVTAVEASQKQPRDVGACLGRELECLFQHTPSPQAHR
jgi:hypothetical protein